MQLIAAISQIDSLPHGDHKTITSPRIVFVRQALEKFVGSTIADLIDKESRLDGLLTHYQKRITDLLDE
jgi:hypothetical protein